MTSKDDKYVVLLRRELVRAQARLKRAERERDAALAENERLRQTLERRPTRRRKRATLEQRQMRIEP
jgi:hypothetical protein